MRSLVHIVFISLAACSDAPTSDAPEAGANDATFDAAAPFDAADASAKDVAPPSPWTKEAESFLVDFGASVATIVPDPTTPRHLLVTMNGTSQSASLAVEWNDGQTSQALIATGGHSYTSGGASFDGAGNMLAYFAGFDQDATPFELASAKSGKSWSWHTLPSPFSYPTWPPRALAVGAGGTPREILFSESAVWDVTGKLDMPASTQWPHWDETKLVPSAEGGFCTVAFVPGDPATFLAGMCSSPFVHRCTFGSSLACDASSTTGLGAHEIVRAIAIGASDQARVYVETYDVSTSTRALRVSTDGGASFGAVSLPLQASFARWASSPISASTLAVYFGASDRMFVTIDTGAHWNELAPPKTPTVDTDALAFDAAGTLFLARGSELFSSPPPQW